MENNKIMVFATSIPAGLAPVKWQSYLNLMPQDIQFRIKRLVNRKDKYSLLFGRLLLMKGLKHFNLDMNLIHKIKYTSHYKPFLDNGIKFNISHSGSIVLCALSANCEVGIDIEQIQEINVEPFYATFTPNQQEAIRKSSNKYHDFYQLWTLKESVIKATGLGMSFPLAHIETDFHSVVLNNTHWYLHSLEVKKGYIAYLAADKTSLIVQSYSWTHQEPCKQSLLF